MNYDDFDRREVYDRQFNSSALKSGNAFRESNAGNGRGCAIAVFVIAILLSLIPFFIVHSVFSNSNSQMTGKHCTYPVQATVCRVESELVTVSGHGRQRSYSYTSYSPVYAFAYNGVSYEVKSFFGDSTPKYAVGAQVDLLINPDNPTEVCNKEDQSSLHMAYLMTMAFPAGVIIVALVLFSLYRKVLRNHRTRLAGGEP